MTGQVKFKTLSRMEVEFSLIWLNDSLYADESCKKMLANAKEAGLKLTDIDVSRKGFMTFVFEEEAKP